MDETPAARKLAFGLLVFEWTFLAATAPKWVPWLIRLGITTYARARGYEPSVGLGI